MKERPILFSAPMVRAILEGRKSQTRRVVKEAYVSRRKDGLRLVPELLADPRMGVGHACPYGVPGDRLWVRETWAQCYEPIGSPLGGRPSYRADLGLDGNADKIESSPVVKWRPSIHMPRWASRITLEITEVRVQRVQEISAEDAIAEGASFTNYGRLCFHRSGPPGEVGDCPAPPKTHPQREGWSMVPTTGSDQCLHTAQSAFANYWNSINGKTYPWSSNPWVWAVSFRRLP